MVEQYYYIMKAQDVTKTLLLKNGFVASYNVPYDDEVYNISGYRSGYGFDYFNDPRDVLFKFAEKK